MNSYLVVDDEVLAVKALRKLLLQLKPDCRIHEASGVDEAVRIYKQESPDLTFMDIEMPQKNGFEFFKILKREHLFPKVVFVSSSISILRKHFRASALDFLEKPVGISDLAACLIRIEERAKEDAIMSLKINYLEEQLQLKTRVKIHTTDSIIIIPAEQIFYAEANGNYTNINLTTEEKVVSSSTLKKIQSLVPKDLFFRVHRSFLINLTYLTSINRKKKTCLIQSPNISKELKVSEDTIPELLRII